MEICLNRRTERVFWDSVISKFYRNSNFVSAFSPAPLWLYVTAFVWILAVAFFNVLHTGSESVIVSLHLYFASSVRAANKLENLFLRYVAGTCNTAT
jgi:hypothetical protein